MSNRLADVRAVLFDMDGVIYRGGTLLPGVADLLAYLRETGRPYLFVTNNATRTPEMFAAKLTRMGVHATPDQFLGSAEVAAAWLAQQHPDGGRVQIVGQEGLYAALFAHGFQPAEDPLHADFVVAGMDMYITYQKLAAACLAINNGARFIGTNGDVSFPTEMGETPGAGSILALLQTATGVAPQIAGKPYPAMFQQAMARLDVTPAQTLMVGDRYETDIVGAVELGILTAGVLTGVTTRERFEQADPPPDLIVADLVALLAMMTG